MNTRRLGVVIVSVGLLIQAIARMASIRDTWVNAVLVGIGLVVLITGLAMLWRSRGVDRTAGT